MSLQERVDSIFGVQPDERALVLLLWLQYLCTGTATAFTQGAAFTLFLGAFDAGKLPFTYVVMALTISPLTLAYLLVGRRLSFAGLLKLSLAAQMVITTGFAVGLAFFNVPWLVFLLPVLFQIVVVFGNMAFWSLAGRMLNVRQGKRLFGLVGSGEWLAFLGVGLLIPVIVPLIGLPGLLWLAVLAMGGAMLAMVVNLRLHGGLLAKAPADGSTPQPDTAAKAPIGLVLRNRYLLLLITFTMLWWIAFFFVDNIFYHQAAAQIPDSKKLAEFLGLYFAVLGGLTLISNTFVSGRVIGRLGLRTSLLILPVGLGIGALLMSTMGAMGGPLLVLFLMAVATKLWGLSVGFSVDQSARAILYQPLPAALRTGVQTLADGVAQPLATGIAGLALLLLGVLFPGTSVPLMFGLVALAVALIGIVLMASTGYAEALVQALDKRRLAGTSLDFSDATSLAILRRELRGGRAGGVIFSMRSLAAVDPNGLVAELPALLVHPVADVRRYALEQVGGMKLRSALPAVRASMDVPGNSTQLHGMALRTLARLGEFSSALENLDASSPPLRAGAIIGLIESGGAEHTARAGNAITELRRSTRPEDRAEAARILEECGGSAPIAELQVLLDDTEPAVQRAALRAAGRVGHADLWPQIIAALEGPATRRAAIAALVAAGGSALPAIGGALRSGTGCTAVTISLVIACGRIGEANAIPLLLALGRQDIVLRTAVLQALRRCGYRTGAAAVREWIEAEVDLAARLSAASLDIGDDGTSGLLETALAAQTLQCRARILDLLSFSGDVAALQRASENLSSEQASQSAYALEVIDIQTPIALRAGVLPVMETLEPHERLDRLKGQFPQDRMDRSSRLADLAADPDGRIHPWTRACALHALGTLGEPELSTELRPLLTSRHELVREAAGRLWHNHQADQGDQPMLSTIEKVIILRTAGIFRETADDVLAEVAAVATVTEASAGSRVLEKGDAGDSMFVIAAGRVQVHDGALNLTELEAGDVFGEMALLDPEPRSASVTALEDSQLLRLDQQVLSELIEERPEVALGLLRVLTRRLRGIRASTDRKRELQAYE